MTTNAVIQEDAEIIARNKTLLSPLQGKTILVTGATGLLGAQLVRALARFNASVDDKVTILALIRNPEKAAKLFPELADDVNVKFIPGNITAPLSIEGPLDFIVHTASATSSRFFVEHPVETIETALTGTRNVAECAKDKGVTGMVYLSSLEVYGTPLDQSPVTESDYGYIDPISVRSSYSESKRMCENLCVAYASEYQVPIKIARLSQTFGAGVSYDDGRVFAEFARCAVEGKNIVLHTEGKTLRTYCYTRDAVEAIPYILLRGESGQAYNVTNPDTGVTIREMAQIVADEVATSKIDVVVEIPDDLASFGYNPEMVIRLDSTKVQALGWKPSVDLPEMFKRMIAGFQK